MSRALLLCLIFFFVPIEAFASIDLSSGLVAHWKMDESSGTTAADATGNGNDATVHGPVTWVAGHFDKAFNFAGDGIPNYMSVDTPTDLIPIHDQPYTTSAWIKSDGAGATQGIIGWGEFGSTNGVNAFRLDNSACSNNGLDNYWWGNDLNLCVNPLNLYDGAWHLVLASYDGSTRKIYMDATLIGSDTPGPHDVPNTNDFGIGVSSILFGEYFNGSLDDVRVYNRALSEAEIGALYTAPDENYTGVISPPKPTRHRGSSSVTEQVHNLLAMGNTSAAQKLMSEWPNLFPATPATIAAPVVADTKDLMMGDRGQEVARLQIALIKAQAGIAATALARVGASGYFGPLTLTALQEYQRAHSIEPALGYFGPKTRTFLTSQSVTGDLTHI